VTQPEVGEPWDEDGRVADPPLLILSSLAEGPKHGYAISRDVAVFGGAPLGPGTLYGALARLRRHGLIEELPGVERRRPYRLTAHGRRVLHARLRGLVLFAETGLDRLARGG
jgi:DNA-binding PadR family transcriptional regulator